MSENHIGPKTGDYTVAIPVFEGPLDLLLQLIEHAELEITAISLAQVTDQFLAHIHRMQVPAAEISAFLVIAAKLIQIKSEALLPRPPSHEKGEENLGEALAQQLLIYKRFKEVATWLGKREESGFHSYARMAAPPHVEGRIDLSGISIVDLQHAIEAVLEDREDKIALGSVITAPRITIREKISMIVSHLSSRSDARFSELVGNSSSRLEVVVTFLALLELIKRYRVTASQDTLFSDIQFIKTTEWDSREELDIEFE